MPALVLATVTDGTGGVKQEVRDRLGDLVELPQVSVLELGPLSQPELRSCVVGTVLSRPLTAAKTKRAIDRSEGNPRRLHLALLELIEGILKMPVTFLT